MRCCAGSWRRRACQELRDCDLDTIAASDHNRHNAVAALSLTPQSRGRSSMTSSGESELTHIAKFDALGLAAAVAEAAIPTLRTSRLDREVEAESCAIRNLSAHRLPGGVALRLCYLHRSRGEHFPGQDIVPSSGNPGNGTASKRHVSACPSVSRTPMDKASESQCWRVFLRSRRPQKCPPVSGHAWTLGVIVNDIIPAMVRDQTIDRGKVDARLPFRR
jgi:hypothetical protein